MRVVDRARIVFDSITSRCERFDKLGHIKVERIINPVVAYIYIYIMSVG